MAKEIITRDIKEFGSNLWSKREKFFDAALTVNETKIKVHSIILASASKVFEDAFEKADSMEMNFDDLDIDILNSIIKYCYTGTIEIPENKAQEIFHMANLFEIPSIMNKSTTTLKKIMNSTNVLSLWKKSEKSPDAKSNIIFPYIIKNFEEVSKSSDFLNLDFSELNELLNSKEKVKSQMILYDAIKKWTNHDNASRLSNLAKLLDHVKLECLPGNVLLNDSQSLCSGDAACLLKFITAMQKSKTGC